MEIIFWWMMLVLILNRIIKNFKNFLKFFVYSKKTHIITVYRLKFKKRQRGESSQEFVTLRGGDFMAVDSKNNLWKFDTVEL